MSCTSRDPSQEFVSTKLVELLAVLATAAAHLATVAWPTVHMAVVILAVLGWGRWLFTRSPTQLRTLGLRREGLASTGLIVGPPGLAVALLCGAWAAHRGHFALPWTLVPMLLLYPLWGLIQQVLVQGVVVRLLAEWPDLRRRPWLVALLGGAVFGLVHLNQPVLMGATAIMGAAFALVYLRHRNVWHLGLWHGWMGACFYLWVLDLDPIAMALGG